MKTTTIEKPHHRAPAKAANMEQTRDLPKPANDAAPEADSESLAIPGREAEESEARKLHDDWLGHQRKSLGLAVKLGGILNSLKPDVPHGKWEAYVGQHLGIEPRTARNYMRLHREASNINTIANLSKTETISDLGIRAALDLLADLKKASKSAAEGSNEDGDSGKRKSSASDIAAGPPPLRLADGRNVDLKQLKWIDGPISRRSIESWIDRSSPDAGDPKATKVEARRQSAVVQIAAVINRACGRAKPEAATELINSSLEVIRTLMREAHT